MGSLFRHKANRCLDLDRSTMPTCKRVPNSKAFNKVFNTFQVSGWKQFGQQSTHQKSIPAKCFSQKFYTVLGCFGNKSSAEFNLYIVAPKKTTRKRPNLLVCGSAWLPQQPRPCLWHLHGGFKRPWEEVHPRKLRQLKRPQNSASASLT